MFANVVKELSWIDVEITIRRQEKAINFTRLAVGNFKAIMHMEESDNKKIVLNLRYYHNAATNPRN